MLERGLFILPPFTYLSLLKNNFVLNNLLLSSFNATLIIDLSIIPLYIYCKERDNKMK